jgi:hypothetical protein
MHRRFAHVPATGTRLTPTLGACDLVALLCSIGWGLGRLNETTISGTAAIVKVLHVQVDGLGLGNETAVAIRQPCIGRARVSSD